MRTNYSVRGSVQNKDGSDENMLFLIMVCIYICATFVLSARHLVFRNRKQEIIKTVPMHIQSPQQQHLMRYARCLGLLLLLCFHILL